MSATQSMSATESVIRVIDRINIVVGRTVMWLAIIMALVQFTVVIMRYVFSIGSIPMQEAIWYMHGILFMLGAGYALLYDGHVRVDIFYREASSRSRAWTDFLGGLIFLIPLCVVTFTYSLSYVSNSWAVREGSTEISGLPFIYLLKTSIWLFAILLGLQALAMVMRAGMHLFGSRMHYNADYEKEVKLLTEPELPPHAER